MGKNCFSPSFVNELNCPKGRDHFPGNETGGMTPRKRLKASARVCTCFVSMRKRAKCARVHTLSGKFFIMSSRSYLKSLFLHPLDDGAISLITHFLKCFQSFPKMQIIRVDVEAQNMDIFALICSGKLDSGNHDQGSVTGCVYSL